MKVGRTYKAEKFDTLMETEARKVLAAMDDAVEKTTGLTLQQRQLALFMIMPDSERPSREELLGRLGITFRQFLYWKDHPKIIKYRSDLTRKYFQDAIPNILYALQRRAERGEVEPAKLFLQYVEMWHPEDEYQKNRFILEKRAFIEVVHTLTNKVSGDQSIVPSQQLTGPESPQEK